MRYYCIECQEEVEHGSMARIVYTAGWEKHLCPLCNGTMISCAAIFKVRTKPPNTNCDVCKYRFRCFTGEK